jgi:hypothetical protein
VGKLCEAGREKAATTKSGAVVPIKIMGQWFEAIRSPAAGWIIVLQLNTNQPAYLVLAILLVIIIAIIGQRLEAIKIICIFPSTIPFLRGQSATRGTKKELQRFCNLTAHIYMDCVQDFRKQSIALTVIKAAG